MSTSFENVDGLGPEKIIEIYDSSTGLKAIVVVGLLVSGVVAVCFNIILPARMAQGSISAWAYRFPSAC